MNEISTEAFEALKDAAESHDGSVLSDYSGRGMFGATCLAITCSSLNDLIRTILKAQELAGGPTDITDYILNGGNMRQDSLGRDMVYYFPGLSVEGLDREEEVRFPDESEG